MSPWTPRIGDRVRVRGGVGREIPCSELRHDPNEQGHAGRVIGDRTRAGAPSHDVLVAFDPPVPVVHMGPIGPIPLHVRQYATDELEPLDP